MAYVVNGLEGVTVDVSQQAVRPREPPRPAPSRAASGPGMATRMLRPRESAASPVSSKYVQKVYALRGKQKQLENLLKVLGNQLRACKQAARSRNPAAARAAQANCVQIEKAIALCIQQIKLCAGKANAAADAAIATGASRSTVIAASASGAASVAKAGTAASGQIQVVETSTAKLLPTGVIVPGAGAKIVSTPVVAESIPQGGPDTEPALTTQDVGVTVSSGSIGTVVVLGVLGFFGYKLAKKRGWL